MPEAAFLNMASMLIEAKEEQERLGGADKSKDNSHVHLDSGFNRGGKSGKKCC